MQVLLVLIKQVRGILARGLGGTDRALGGPHFHDLGLLFPSTARANEFSAKFIIWHWGQIYLFRILLAFAKIHDL